jgi:hypothetical protein
MKEMMNDMDEHKWKSFRDWSNSGYLIIKGSKGTKMDGVYKFNETQVKPKDLSREISDSAFDSQEYDNGCYGGDPNDHGDS